MHPIQKHLFETNFQDLAGSRIEGTIVVSEALINLGVMDFLNNLQQAPATAPEVTPEKTGSAPSNPPDPKALLSAVKVEQLNIRMEKGKLLIDLKAGI